MPEVERDEFVPANPNTELAYSWLRSGVPVGSAFEDALMRDFDRRLSELEQNTDRTRSGG